MKTAADTVSAILAHHGETFGFNVFLNSCADGAQIDSRFDHFEGQIEAFLGNAAQALAKNSRLADDKHL